MEFSEERVFTPNAFFAVEPCLVIRYLTPVGKETDDKGGGHLEQKLSFAHEGKQVTDHVMIVTSVSIERTRAPRSSRSFANL